MSKIDYVSYAGVTQKVECLPCKQDATGSIPVSGSIEFNDMIIPGYRCSNTLCKLLIKTTEGDIILG